MNYLEGYAIGALVGGIIAVYLLTRLILLGFRDRKFDTSSIVVAALIALGIATVLAGYGFAEGGPPNFAQSFSAYVIPTLIVIVIEFLRVKRWKSKSNLPEG